MSVSLRKRGLCDFNGAATRVGTVSEETLRDAVSLDLGENQLTTLQKPFQLATFSTPLSKRDVRARQQLHADPIAAAPSASRCEAYEEDDESSALSDMRCLRYISVAHNALRSLAGVGAVADTLTVLVAPHNQLESVQGLQRCVHLRYVDLRHNRLRSLAGLPTSALPPLVEPAGSSLRGEGTGSPRGIKPTSKIAPNHTTAPHSSDVRNIIPPFEPGTAGLADGGIVLLLSNNRLRGRAVMTLATPPTLTERHHAQLEWPAPTTWASFVSVLDLSANPLEEVGDVERLLHAPHLVQLKEVNLSYTPLLVNGSLASAMLSAVADGAIEWPTPPPSTTRVELFPEVSADVRSTDATGFASTGKRTTASPSAAEVAAACEEAVQRERTLCRLASAFATALWRPDKSSLNSAAAVSTTPAPRWPKEPRHVRLLGAAPTIEFVLDSLSAAKPAHGRGSGGASAVPTTAQTPPRPGRTVNASAVLSTPPPVWTSPDKTGSGCKGTRETAATSPVSSPVPPIVAHTLPRHVDTESRAVKGGAPRQGNESSDEVRRRLLEVPPHASPDKVNESAGSVNCSRADGGSAPSSALHTSTWSANEVDPAVGYMVFKGRQPRTQTELSLRGEQTPSGPQIPPSGGVNTRPSSTGDVTLSGATPPASEPEMDTMSSITETESVLSRADSRSQRVVSRQDRNMLPTATQDSAAGSASLEVQLSVLLAENQALRRRNADLEARYRTQKQLLTQHKISIDILQDELHTARCTSSAGRDSAQRDKAEVKRLRGRVAALEQQLAKAYGAASATRTLTAGKPSGP